jgi:hypothetical protein
VLEILINWIFAGIGTAIGSYFAEKKLFKRLDYIEKAIKKYFKQFEPEKVKKVTT